MARIRAQIVSVTTGAAVMLLSLTACSSEKQDCRSYKFDRASWLDPVSTGGTESARLKAFQMLEKCKQLLHKSPAQVRALLGPPLEWATPTEWNYRLGDGSFDGIEATIRFEQRRVTRVYHGEA
jgi:hypothetical protein